MNALKYTLHLLAVCADNERMDNVRMDVHLLRCLPGQISEAIKSPAGLYRQMTEDEVSQ